MNEPAFPSSVPCLAENSHLLGHYEGLSIRDYFAAKILPTVYSDYCKEADNVGYVEGWRIGVAKDAYMMADAMLAERNK